MRRRLLVRVVVGAALTTGASLAVAFSTGPPVSRTGAFQMGGVAGENLCTLCHNMNPANDGTGLLEMFGVPQIYQTGDTVTFRLALSRPTPPEYPEPKWGFQITAVSRLRGQGAGTWLPQSSPPEDLQQVLAPSPASVFRTRRYLEHTSMSTRTGQRDFAEWTIKWVAPSTDSGAIYFFASGNAANGDELAIGSDDHIFTAVDSIRPATWVDVPPPSRPTYTTVLHAPFPNPMTLCGDMSFEVARAGHVSLTIHDVQGRRVRTLFNGHHEAGPGFAFWDGRGDHGARAPNGVYFVRFSAPGLQRPMVRKVSLAR